MSREIIRVSILFLVITVAGLGALYFSSNTSVSGTSISGQGPISGEQQSRGWRVWVKQSPCSGRFDWLAVAKDGPPPDGGGLSFYVPYENILAPPPTTKLTCKDPNSMMGCTFAEANELMEALRPSAKFLDYCCRDYSVWENSQTSDKSVFLIRTGTPGLGFMFVKGNLCCEQAEEIAGKPGVCSGRNSGGPNWGQMNQNAGLNGKTLTFYGGTTPEQCQGDCDKNPMCKAFTLIRAGAYGSNGATCYLMSEATSFAPSPCCISAIKSGGANAPTPTPAKLPPTPKAAENPAIGTWTGTMRTSRNAEERIVLNFRIGLSGKLEGYSSGLKVLDLEVRGNVITWKWIQDSCYTSENTLTINPDGKTASGGYTVTNNCREGAKGTGYFFGFTKN